MRHEAREQRGARRPADGTGAIGLLKDDAPTYDAVSSVSDPLNINLGIGLIVNPVPDYFAKHDHDFVSPNIPNPAAAQVTYHFDTPTIVDSIRIIQHVNGVTRLEGFVGNSPDQLTSIGQVFGTKGDVTGGWSFTEFESDVFDFNSVMAGTYFRFVVTKTTLADGWALHRAIPIEMAAPSVPDTCSSLLLFCISLTGLAGLRRRFARK